MHIFSELIDFIRNLDVVLAGWINTYGAWTYGLLFTIVFAETGLVIFPFLPGDSLLFTAGLLSHESRTGLNVWFVSLTFILAAFFGDNVNYYLGKTFGHKAFKSDDAKIFKKSHLQKTNWFFENYGAKTLIMARFVPFVRTFAPFVAGMGAMTYQKFIFWSIIAAVIWVTVCVGAGYFFGGLPVVKDNFELAILGIIAVSVIPPAIEIIRHKMKKKKAETSA
ncbi:MAG TPA: DedA family protein [Fimbriimonadaceae bacterium]|nr:DedA family protein [Fimbriimonadaceae bacterium]